MSVCHHARVPSSEGSDDEPVGTTAGPVRRRLRDRAKRFVRGATAEQFAERDAELFHEFTVMAQGFAADPSFSGRIVAYPNDEGDHHWTLPVVDDTAFDPAVVPPEELRRVGEDFLEGGRLHVDSMKEILGRHGFDLRDADGILDFGCSVGRMLRWLADLAETQPVWGVDIEVEAIRWAQQHMSPPFNFSTCSTTPHLPFEDRTFGLVYAGSVFTHIEDLADAWLLELRRITRPGGYLYLTVHDQSTMQNYLQKLPHELMSQRMAKRPDLFERLGVDHAVIGDRAGGNVFYDRAYLERLWGRWFDILEIVDEGWFNQTVMVLRRPEA